MEITDGGNFDVGNSVSYIGSTANIACLYSILFLYCDACDTRVHMCKYVGNISLCPMERGFIKKGSL